MTPFRFVSSRAKVGIRTYGTGEAEVRALDGVDVAIGEQRFVAVMGPSGSASRRSCTSWPGWTVRPSGTVEIAGTEVTKLDDKALTVLRRDKVGFIFQAFNLLPVLTAEENILLPLSIAGRSPDREWVDRLDRRGRPA